MRTATIHSSSEVANSAIRDDDFLQLTAAWTHLTSADDPEDPATDQQAELFDSACEALEDEVGPIPLQHIANSAATLTRPDLHRDIVRPGIALYGYPPVPADVPLRPAMTLSSRLALVKEVPEGHSVGYGRMHRTSRSTTLGLVPIEGSSAEIGGLRLVAESTGGADQLSSWPGNSFSSSSGLAP